MVVQQDNSMQDRSSVLVTLDQQNEIRQPASFRCCPLGVQFYVKSEMEADSVFDITLDVPSSEGEEISINCTGVVVHCSPDEQAGLYRIWVYFLDLPDAVRNHLHCIAKESETLCPYCENF